MREKNPVISRRRRPERVSENTLPVSETPMCSSIRVPMKR